MEAPFAHQVDASAYLSSVDRVNGNARTALLALHYQNEVLHPDGKILGFGIDDPRRDQVVGAAGRLLGGARGFGVPVVSVRIAFRRGHRDVIANAPIFRDVMALGAVVDGSWGAEFYEGLGPEEHEYVVTHNRINAFYGSGLDIVLQMLRPTCLVMAGIATNSVVEHTARHAADIGYEVIVAGDACSCVDRSLHEASLANLAYVARISSVDEVLVGFAADGGRR